MSDSRKASALAVRPQDAATLIIIRRDFNPPRVLMGQRHENHKFMPNRFVFPGGRIDPGDSLVKPMSDLSSTVKQRLLVGCSEARARGLAMAAIRETFEEAGLIVGKPHNDQYNTRSKPWVPFFAEGFAPTLAPLELLARAITPPYRPRRFDARFFYVDAEHVQGLGHPHLSGSGELLKLHWVTPADAQELELPAITRIVLQELEKRLNVSQEEARAMPMPFYYSYYGKHRYKTIP